VFGYGGSKTDRVITLKLLGAFMSSVLSSLDCHFTLSWALRCQIELVSG